MFSEIFIKGNASTKVKINFCSFWVVGEPVFIKVVNAQKRDAIGDTMKYKCR